MQNPYEWLAKLKRFALCFHNATLWLWKHFHLKSPIQIIKRDNSIYFPRSHLYGCNFLFHRRPTASHNSHSKSISFLLFVEIAIKTLSFVSVSIVIWIFAKFRSSRWRVPITASESATPNQIDAKRSESHRFAKKKKNGGGVERWKERKRNRQ